MAGSSYMSRGYVDATTAHDRGCLMWQVLSLFLVGRKTSIWTGAREFCGFGEFSPTIYFDLSLTL